MKLTFEQHFMSPSDFAKSLPVKEVVNSSIPLPTSLPKKDIPWAQVLLIAGLTIGIIAVGVHINESIQEKKRREKIS